MGRYSRATNHSRRPLLGYRRKPRFDPTLCTGPRNIDRREGRPESIETSSIHMDVIRDLKRINGHLTTVAYPILEVAGELAETRLKTVEPLTGSPVRS